MVYFANIHNIAVLQASFPSCVIQTSYQSVVERWCGAADLNAASIFEVLEAENIRQPSPGIPH